MHRVLLALAAAAAITAVTPAQGQSVAASSFSASSAFRSSEFVSEPRPGRAVTGHRRHIHVDDRVLAAGYGYSGYNDYGDFDGNRSFDPNKWNDWWHDRPDRAFPRWVWRNQNCTEDRMWWSGSGWRCTP
ncbi:MAG: hypothetical protein ACJ8FS_07570 [Sphingomicrobium sp.]